MKKVGLWSPYFVGLSLYMCNNIWVDIDNLDLGQVLSVWHYGKVEHTHGNMGFASTC